MSLTAILDQTPTRRALAPLIAKPEVPTRMPPLIEPGEFHRGTMGTAFELLFMAELRQKMPVAGEVMAPSYGLDLLRSWAGSSLAREHWIEIKASYKRWADTLADPEHTLLPLGPAAQAALGLARIASVYRAYLWWLLRMQTDALSLCAESPRHAVLELLGLLDLVPWDTFLERGPVFVNPHFGRGSKRLGGADADLVLGDAMIDIKTSARCSVGIEDVRQLVCYTLLANRYGLNGERRVRITRFGFYLARIGRLYLFDLRESVAREDDGRVLRVIGA